MSQWVKVLVTKVNDLSLIPKIHCGREMRKEKNLHHHNTVHA